jgi:hypothetical protein
VAACRNARRQGASLGETSRQMENTLIEQFGTSRYGAPRRYDTHHRGITALEYGQAVPVLVTTLEQLQQHGADAAVWRRLGRTGEQTLTAALDNPDGDALYRRQAARADADEEQRRAAEREARRPVCKRCGAKFLPQRVCLRAGDRPPRPWPRLRPPDQTSAGCRSPADRSP